MKTDDLISILAKDEVLPERRPFWQWMGFGIATLMLFTAFLWFSSRMGIRADYLDAIWQMRVLFKQLLPLFVAVSLYPVVRSLAFPEGKFNTAFLLPLFIYAGFMIVLFFWAWNGTPDGARSDAIIGTSRLKCLITIPIYSWIVMGFVFVGLRQMAPSHPRRLAVIAALTSASAATVIYAFGCMEDSPLFYAIWYNVAMSIAVIFGAAIGARVLKW